MPITISDEHYTRILSYIGAPFLTLDDGFEMDANQVKEIIIKPVMEKFFTWFPIMENSEHAVSVGNFEFPYPDEYTFSVIDGRYTHYVNTLTPSSAWGGNPLATRFGLESGYSRYGIGGGRDYGESASRATRQATNDALLNLYKVFRFEPIDSERVVRGYSSMPGAVVFKWVKYSDNFNAIPFHKRPEVIQLAGAELLIWFAALRNQTNSEFPVQFNSEAMMERGKELREEVLDKWKNFAKGGAVR
jgi:hypothetical protein